MKNIFSAKTIFVFFFFLLYIYPVYVFAWDITADFEQGTLGTEAQGVSGLSNAFSQTLFSNEQVYTGGTKSAKVSFTQGTDAWATAGGSVMFPSTIGEGGELWARGYFYFKSPWSWTCSPVVKIFRGAHVQTSVGANVGYLSLFADTNGAILLSNEVQAAQPSTGVYFDVNKWQSIEMYVKFSTTSPVFRIWKNGTLIYQDITSRTLNSVTDTADFSYIFTYWNGNVPQNQVSYIDDFYYTTTTPSKVDAAGNFMIGPIIWPIPSAPSNLR